MDKTLKRDLTSKRSNSANASAGGSLLKRVVLSGGSLGMLGQMALMYLNSTYHKTGTEWIPDVNTNMNIL